MLSVSQQFKDAFRDPRRYVEFKAVIAGVEYGPSQIVDLTIRDSIQDGETFGIGTVFSSELGLSLRTTDEIPVNAEVRLYLRAADLTWDMATMSWIAADVPWEDASTESIPYGVYYVDSRKEINGYWRFTCYDALLQSEQPFVSALTYPATMSAVLAEACAQAGVPSAVTVSSSLVFQIAPTGYSCRGVIRLVAQAAASCARIGKDGYLSFVPFKRGTSAETITTSEYRKLTHTNPVKTITRLVCIVDDEGSTLEAGTGGADNTVTIENPYMNQAAVNSALAQLSGTTYNPFTMDWIFLPWLEVGDPVTMQEFIGDTWENTGTAWNETDIPWDGIVTFDSVILVSTITYRGGLTGQISASSDSAPQSEFKPVGTLTDKVNKLSQSTVKQGRNYFGVTITKEDGLIVERDDHLTKLTLNSDVWDWRVNGNSLLYLDALAGTLKFAGALEAASGTFAGALMAATGTFEGDVQGGRFLGGEIVIGSGSNVFKANDSGIWAGHSSFGSAPFSVDMTGHLFAFNAEIQGDISASSIHGGTIDGTTITGTNIFGSYIATSNGSYPRAEMNNSLNSFVVYSNASNYSRFIANSSGFPALDFNFGGLAVTMYGNSSLFALDSTGIPMVIGPSNADLNLVGNNVMINNQSFSSKADKSSFTGTLYVANSSGGTATRAISVVNGVIQ